MQTAKMHVFARHLGRGPMNGSRFAELAHSFSRALGFKAADVTGRG